MAADGEGSGDSGGRKNRVSRRLTRKSLQRLEQSAEGEGIQYPRTRAQDKRAAPITSSRPETVLPSQYRYIEKPQRGNKSDQTHDPARNNFRSFFIREPWAGK